MSVFSAAWMFRSDRLANPMSSTPAPAAAVDDVLVLLHPVPGVVARDEQDTVNAGHGPVEGRAIVVVTDSD